MGLNLEKKIEDLEKGPNLERLRLELDRLDPAPRATASILWHSSRNDLNDPDSECLINAARFYWEGLRFSKEPPPSTLKREVDALATYAQKLANGLLRTQIMVHPIWMKEGFSLFHWRDIEPGVEEEWGPGDASDRLVDLMNLEAFLRHWSSTIEVAPVGPKCPPIKSGADWNDETMLACMVAVLCNKNKRTKNHALPITKVILSWASENGSRTRPLGSKAWKLAKDSVEESMNFVAERQRNGG